MAFRVFFLGGFRDLFAFFRDVGLEFKDLGQPEWGANTELQFRGAATTTAGSHLARGSKLCTDLSISARVSRSARLVGFWEFAGE